MKYICHIYLNISLNFSQNNENLLDLFKYLTIITNFNCTLFNPTTQITPSIKSDTYKSFYTTKFNIL